MNQITPVILCGGSGTRMWPVSRTDYPKQFLNLVGGELSIFQATLLRMPKECQPAILVCNEHHRHILSEQVGQLEVPVGSVILEAASKNTAAAITLAALSAIKEGKDPILLVVPSDHIVKDKAEFLRCVQRGIKQATQDKLVAMGVQPNHPETGYGYIQRGEEIAEDTFIINRFVEKPDYQSAKEFINSGDYFWNSGMFMFKASVFLDEMSRYSADIFQICKKSLKKRQKDSLFISVDKATFEQCPSDSIDYAVMEKTSCASVVALHSPWSDIGSWSSVWDVAEKDKDGNCLQGDVICQNGKNNFVHSSHRLVSLVGMDNAVVVETSDAVLVVNKCHDQDIKALVSELKGKQRKEHDVHREVHRPWGKFDAIDNGSRYQVKHLTVKPGKRLSVQMHHHRAEHWIIVSGTAKVTIDKKETLLTENQSAYIPIGAVHCLENPGSIPLELIEVQTGSYLGEDDIVRFSDDYGRT
ncbi:MAG: mannose-1-phosphate guanylyltransferase/mannose-6-phosphate isomerase [Bermanella sp.]